MKLVNAQPLTMGQRASLGMAADAGRDIARLVGFGEFVEVGEVGIDAIQLAMRPRGSLPWPWGRYGARS